MGENVKRTGRELAYQGSILTVYKDYMEFETAIRRSLTLSTMTAPLP